MGVKDRLTEFLTYKNIGQAKFAGIVGLSKGYVNNIVNTIGPKAKPKIEAAFPDLNIDWLLSGEGEMLIDPADKIDTDDTDQIPTDMTINRLLDALERRDQQVAEAMAQNSRLISVIERLQGVSTQVGVSTPPQLHTPGKPL